LENSSIAVLKSEGSGRDSVKEVISENRGQFAFFIIHRGKDLKDCDGGSSEDIIIGKWSLSQGSAWVSHANLGVRMLEQKVRSITERVPYEEFRWVGVPWVLRRFRSSIDSRILSRILPRELVQKILLEVIPHVGLCALKSPQRR